MFYNGYVPLFTFYSCVISVMCDPIYILTLLRHNIISYNVFFQGFSGFSQEQCFMLSMTNSAGRGGC
jgi:hypothetical protein